MVPHPQSRPRQVAQRPPTRSATTLTGGLILHAKVELISSQSQAIRLQLPELNSSPENRRQKEFNSRYAKVRRRGDRRSVEWLCRRGGRRLRVCCSAGD